MILYHFTSAQHLRAIGKHGLTVGDVPTDISRGKGRVGVWLTTADSPVGHGLEGSSVDKTAYRLKISVKPDSTVLRRWLDWSKENVTPETIELLHRTTGARPETWFIYFGIIEPAAILECFAVREGRVVENWADHLSPALCVRGIPAWRRDAWQRQMLKRVRRAVA